MKNLQTGDTVRIIFQDAVTGHAIVKRVAHDDTGELYELCVTMQKTGKEIVFAHIEDAFGIGWRKLFRNPMPGAYWAYNPSAPMVSFQKVK